MILIRDNKPRFLAGHKMAAVAMRTRLLDLAARTTMVVIVAGWKKEAAP
ncbi:MAG: hypothetical protein JXM79_25880 [Sedimentisphaerales bacterium]|nr:hypothetical protein [Sedimentisphaerales bacterium]